eukprot:CAMPEP_0183702422 /NCGR_PEP_ID=MMETSP0737-20130205/525_1 /TAXON_ID=385413 /ORGANISM="Thalassiosira miniscula, Strain CCMP1093" /LENGTH=1055 /DNA_ID=CAMNT_0025929021 /DNA_START=182 /DNA_END=3349 /DNA_ORIENTATION=-
MSSLDYLTLDMDDVDEVTDLLDHHSHNHRSVATASTSARDLLSRMQLAQEVMQQQQQQSGQSFANNLVDGLVNDDWNNAGGSGELFELDDAAALVGSPDHAPGIAMPPLLSSSTSPSAHVTPTMDDIFAAYWHGRATGAMASAAASGGGGGAAAAAASSPSLTHRRRRHHRPFNLESTPANLPAIPLPAMSRSAAALTANLATASAVATTEALNAQLLQHWNTMEDAAAAAAAVMGAPSAWDAASPSTSSLDAFSPYGGAPAPAFSSSPSLENASSPPTAAQSYMAQLLAATGQESSATAAAAAASTAASIRNRRIRDANTASSLLESRLELVRANAVASAHRRDAAATASAAVTNPNSGRDLLSSLLDFEDNLGGDGDDSIGTVDNDVDNGDNDDMPSLDAAAEAGGAGGTTERASCSPRADPAPSSPTSNVENNEGNESSTAAAAAGDNHNNGRVKKEDESTASTAPDAPPPHRPRRQAALRGLERISTALATHGMGGGSESDDDAHNRQAVSSSASGSKRDASKSNAKTSAATNNTARKRAPTIIPKPSNKNPPKDHVKSEEPTTTCCICLDEPSPEELAKINGCSHPFCFSCIEKWADQENTCPLCKARFFKIDRVNKPKKRKGASSGCSNDEVRSSKRVRNRDQRSDHSFVNPLEGIFASMEANGTWPTHIAQLLFSGLGASSFPTATGQRHHSDVYMATASAAAAAQRRSAASSIFSAPSHSAFAAARRQQQQREHHAFRFRPLAAGNGHRSSSSTAGHSQRYGGPAYAAAPGSSGNRSSDPASSPSTFLTFPQIHHLRSGPRRRATTPRMPSPAASGNNPHNPFPSAEATSPWSTNASVSMALGPHGFASNRSSTSSNTSTSSFQTFSNPSSGGGRMDPLVNAQTNPSFLSGEEEEELLSTLSPSSYIRRLHRELEGSSGSVAAPSRERSPAGQYQFNAFPNFSGRAAARRNNRNLAASDNTFGAYAASAAPAPSSRALPLHGARSQRQHNELSGHGARSGASQSSARNNSVAHGNAAGRTVETALEIDSDDDDDDDVVEVIDVEALI